MLISKAALLGGAILAATLVSACGGGNDNMTAGGGGTTSTGTTGSGAGSTTSGTTTTSSSSSSTGSSGSLTDDPPQVIKNTGTVLTAPKVQLIAYAEDPNAADCQAFYEEFASTTEWAAQTAEYGVGPLTVLPPIMIAGTPPKTLNDNNGTVTPFEQTLIDNITGANPAWGAADPSTIYMFQLPSGTNIDSGGSCCTDFLGYHYEVAVDASTSVAYGISCNCGAQQGPPTLTELQLICTNLSHEAVEAATDPFFLSSLGWSGTDPDHLAWTTLTGGEVADMCEFNLDSNYQPPGSKYMVQRSWSNAAAKAGTNPCVPVPANGPYFNSIPVLTDTVDETDQFGSSSPTKGVIIPIGQSKTIDVQLEADGTTSGPWTVTAFDGNYYLTGQNPFLDVSFDGSATSGMSTATGSAGDVLHLTIKALKADTNDISAIFVLQSDLGSGTNVQENLSVGAVGN